MAEPVIEDYDARGRGHRAAHDAHARTARRIGWARLVLFVGLILGAPALLSAAGRTGLIIVEGAGVLAFAAFAVWHGRVKERVWFAGARDRACTTGIARVERNWNALPKLTWPDPSAASPMAAPTLQAVELHITGTQSLARLLPAVSPSPARQTLLDWLTAENPPARAELLRRQAIARELVPLVDWRERMSIFASRLRGGQDALTGFTRWTEDGDAARDSSSKTRLLTWTARALSVATLIAIVAATRGAIPAVAPMVFFAINIIVSNRGRHRLALTLRNIASDDRRILGYANLFAEAASPTFTGAEARDVQERAGEMTSTAALRRLERVVTLGDLRFSPMAHILAQAIVLWDMHVIDALDTWRRSNGARVGSWLRAMAELETCAALATLAHDNPEWDFPTIEAVDGGVVECAGLAHPLLSSRVRVANDVTIGPSNTVLFVTGPNMAGKSTLLRSIGLNVVLAQAGGPVCAERMRLGTVRLRTSIHVQDAFEEGVSLFMAELIRVKRIVDASREENSAPVLYLIDEMLRGTNAEERHIAVASVLTHLTATGAIGVVATHDLELARAPSLAGKAHSVHFTAELRESGEGPRVQFDFRLRPGPATQRNAMRLVEMLGLGAAVTKLS